MSQRDFTSISPSAFSLLRMKGHTTIPFAREAAVLVSRPEPWEPDFHKKELSFWARTVHFEQRYRSIDALLADLQVNQVLELSSGFSFRGLSMIATRPVHYIDTDLPEMMATKQQLLAELRLGMDQPVGELEMLPLNALDEEQFHSVVARFGEGPIAIVNEGLLMYLNRSEKERLCRLIRDILKKRGGYWITADIYLRNQEQKFDLKLDESTKAFFAQHNLEENKFGSFEEATSFFQEMGFVIEKQAAVERSELSSLKHLIRNASFFQLMKLRKGAKLQATWRLKV
ncbi:MAG: class I SAM-dependent methyltransferase [Marinilabiliales bacterium]|nr:class I SAM-dependent methyltransferase [Marinilabiliales bacterium]